MCLYTEGGKIGSDECLDWEGPAISKLVRITKAALSCLALGLGVSAVSGTAFAHEVPNRRTGTSMMDRG